MNEFEAVTNSANGPIIFQPPIPTNNHVEPGKNITLITPKKAGPVDSTRVAEEVKGGQGTPVPP